MSDLAIAGGPPFRQAPFAPWPHFEEDEINAVTDVLRSGRVNYWTGNECRSFEREFAEYVGSRHAISMSNGTTALEAALYGIGLNPGDEVIVPSRTFIATASSVVIRGGTPVVADIDPVSQNLTPDTVRPRLTRWTKGIIAVHLAGWACDMDPLMDLAKEMGLYVIEDCAQALGASYKGRMAGTLGHVAAFSFCQDKILTTGGEGGMITTSDPHIWERAWSFKDHGKNYQKITTDGPRFVSRLVHDHFGTNARMTEMQAAVGRCGLKKLNRYLSIRRRNALQLQALLKDCQGLRLESPPPYVNHAYYKFYAFVLPDELKAGWNRDRILAAINAEGIPCAAGSASEIYREGAFRGLHPDEVRYGNTRLLGETSLMFLVHPTLSERDMQDTAAVVKKVMLQACRV